MAKPKRPPPIRSEDNTTYSWSLTKELKAKIFKLADKDGRTMSGWLTHVLGPQVETLLQSKGIVIRPQDVEGILEEMRSRGLRG